MSTHALHQAFWSALIAGQLLSPLQILALIFGFLGVTSISLFDIMAQKCTKAKDEQINKVDF